MGWDVHGNVEIALECIARNNERAIWWLRVIDIDYLPRAQPLYWLRDEAERRGLPADMSNDTKLEYEEYTNSPVQNNTWLEFSELPPDIFTSSKEWESLYRMMEILNKVYKTRLVVWFDF